MHDVEIIFGLLLVVAALAVVSQKLVLGGLVLGFIPGLPEVELKPKLVFDPDAVAATAIAMGSIRKIEPSVGLASVFWGLLYMTLIAYVYVKKHCVLAFRN